MTERVNSAARKHGRPKTAVEQFGAQVAALRRRAGLSHRQLAELAHIGKSTIGRAEAGIVPPTEDVALALDLALDAQGALVALGEAARTEPYSHFPPPPRQFTGRAELLAQLDEHGLDPDGAAPVLFIAGPPGAGKTTLALHWATIRIDEFDLVLWADLRGYAAGSPADPGDVLEELLRGAGVNPAAIPAATHHRQALLRGHLQRRQQRVLIVLDNARDSPQVQPVLPGTPGTTVLVTSRRRLSGLIQRTGALALTVGPLHDDDSVAMLTELIGAERAAQDPAALGRIAGLCAHLPLALSIAAERIAATERVTLAEHALDLADAGQRLERLTVADDDIGVRQAFHWSYTALDAAAARLFRLLGLHPGAHFSVAAAAALAGIDDGEADRLLETLAQAHLVSPIDRHRYRFHDLVRVYAAEQAAHAEHEPERAAAVGRLCWWYVHGANASTWALMPSQTRDHHITLDPPPPRVRPPVFEDYDTAHRWCSRELRNFTPVASLALREGHRFVAWRLAVELIDFFLLTNPWPVWMSVYRVSLQAAEAEGDAEWIAEAATKLAEGYRRAGDLAESQHYDSMTVRFARTLGRPVQSLGWALVGLGNDAHALGDYPMAAKLCREGLEVFQAAGSQIGVPVAHVHLGRALRALGDRIGAVTHGTAGVAPFEHSQDQHGFAFSVIALARTHHHFGDLDLALQVCERALRSYDGTPDDRGRAEALGLQGQILAARGEVDAGLDALARAEALVRTLDPGKAERLRADIATIRAGATGCPGPRSAAPGERREAADRGAGTSSAATDPDRSRAASDLAPAAPAPHDQQTR
ncbi:helix-turn-helix domain-containing protein [Amycolatopsis magusensis]|uniref:helix-turn-helix domain-containing protein n=1 Tax=Amycolatopsis magusensis TaxID=882444 RepID=UPI0037A6343C